MGTLPSATDESPRVDATLENLAKLKPVFDKNGTVTAGNASSINDGAAALVLMEEHTAGTRGLKPLGRLVDCAVVGVDPKYMGIGPVPAVRELLRKTGLPLEAIDVIELNEAFAAQALAVIRDLGLAIKPDESERQRHLARASHWRDGCDPCRQVASRTAPDRRPLWFGDDVHRGWAGNCCAVRSDALSFFRADAASQRTCQPPVYFDRLPSQPSMCGHVRLCAPLPAMMPMCPPGT